MQVEVEEEEGEIHLNFQNRNLHKDNRPFILWLSWKFVSLKGASQEDTIEKEKDRRKEKE